MSLKKFLAHIYVPMFFLRECRIHLATHIKELLPIYQRVINLISKSYYPCIPCRVKPVSTAHRKARLTADSGIASSNFILGTTSVAWNVFYGNPIPHPNFHPLPPPPPPPTPRKAVVSESMYTQWLLLLCCYLTSSFNSYGHVGTVI